MTHDALHSERVRNDAYAVCAAMWLGCITIGACALGWQWLADIIFGLLFLGGAWAFFWCLERYAE